MRRIIDTAVIDIGKPGDTMERLKIIVDVPITLPSLANARLHWRAKAKIVQKQREAVAVMLRVAMADAVMPALPAKVTLTRFAPRKLDPGDNLNGSMKAVRDQIAAWFGVDDSSSLYEWVYEQEKAKIPFVRIEIEGMR